MKIALCCIAKNENQYIREWIKHYYDLKFDKIFIYDNNNIDGEKFEDIIQDYIDSDFVKVINYRGKEKCQMDAYRNCYYLFNEYYDYIAYFDCDEFLMFVDPNMDIKTFFNLEHLKNVDQVLINWKFYDDNDQIFNTGYGVKERFTNAKQPYDFVPNGMECSYNCHVKSIIKCKQKDLIWETNNPHILIKEKLNLNAIQPSGKKYDKWESIFKLDYKVCWLNHYSYKTIQEYFDKRLKGYPNTDKLDALKQMSLKKFFDYNKMTKEKISFIINNW